MIVCTMLAIHKYGPEKLGIIDVASGSKMLPQSCHSCVYYRVKTERNAEDLEFRVFVISTTLDITLDGIIRRV